MTSTQNLRKFAFNVHPDGRVDAMTMVPGNIHDAIPTGIYRIRFDGEEKNLYLELSEFPNPPPKIYGSVHKDTARYLKTFETQDTCMGIGLYGLKGTGKTTTLQVIAKTALGMDYPVVIVDHAIPLNMLANLFAKIKQNIVVMFDEFDKHYYNPELNEETSAQNGILSILDGSCGGGKKLTIICANDYSRVNEYLKGRPGRIRYSKFFESLKFPEVIEYFKDNYKRGMTTKEIIQLAIMTQQIKITYDLLKAYVTESNIHNESIVNSIEAISNEVFYELKTNGTFGDQYSCINCFDEKEETYFLRINGDYSYYTIFKRTKKINEFEFAYSETTQITRGDFSELKITLGDSGFEIETDTLKFKTKNYLFDTEHRSDEAIIKDSESLKNHNPNDRSNIAPVRLEHPHAEDIHYPTGWPSAAEIVRDSVKMFQHGIHGSISNEVGHRNIPFQTNKDLNWDFDLSQTQRNSRINASPFNPPAPDEPLASSNG